MKGSKLSVIAFSVLLQVMLLIGASAVAAQTTAFTYQGRLTDGGNPANGVYDIRFELYPDAINGLALSEPIIYPTLEVTNGVFSVRLGFSEELFTGEPRYIEIGIRPAGSPDLYTILSPRQPILSVPYAVRSLTAASAENSNQLGGVAASGFIQNGSSQQAATNFNISGTGTLGGTLNANTVNTTTQYNLNGSRVLSVAGTNNFFAGLGTGAANTTGNSNTFVGAFAGNDNTTANNNSFFGAGAGRDTTTGANNSFFGAFAGDVNTTGGNNAFFGPGAGGSNTTASGNSFFGSFAGTNNIGGPNNSFFGADAGAATTVGSGNSFFGARAGVANLTGSNNTFFGEGAGDATTNGNFNSFFGRNAGRANTTGSNNTLIGNDTNLGANNLSFATAIGAGALVSTSNTLVLGRGSDTVRVPGDLNVFGTISLMQLGSAGATALCYNGTTDEIAFCSSSLRYKDRIVPFATGLEVINQLRPITFSWIENGARDLGLGAEEVAAVEPLLVTYNERGQVEGVKYDRIGVVLINAIKQQQSQIEALKKIVCLDHPKADVCR